jgi:hypothetical protein
MPRDVLLGVAPLSLEKASRLQEQAKACAGELFRENGGHQRIAELFGISTARAYNFTNRNNAEQVSFWRILAATSAKATAAARFLATMAGGAFVPLAAVGGVDAMRMLGESARSHGQAIAEAVKALADGSVDGREASAVIKEIDAAMADLASLRGAVVTMAEGGR